MPALGITLKITDADGQAHDYDLRLTEGGGTLTRLDTQDVYHMDTPEDGAWRCSCESWKYSRDVPRTCKHLRKLEEAMSEKKTLDLDQLANDLSKPFEPSEVKFKPGFVLKGQGRAIAMPYVDARVVMERLDDVLGVAGWKDSYEFLDGGSVLCSLSVRLGDEWITKEDVGGQSEQPDTGDRCKAAVSDALKRAAIKFGVGRYLYRLPVIWAPYDENKKKFARDPVLPGQAAPGPHTPAPQKTLPSNWKELRPRLEAKDAELVKEGLCAKDSLLNHVHAFLSKQFGADSAKWDRRAVQAAAEEVKVFEHKRRAEKPAKAG